MSLYLCVSVSVPACLPTYLSYCAKCACVKSAADICDDCCDDQPDISAMAQIYNILKTIDPYHLVTGAVNCDDVW